MDYNDALEILELQTLAPKDITNDIIKKQYHKLALLYHPDKCKNPNNKHFIEIKKAYEYLNHHPNQTDTLSKEAHYSGFIESMFGCTLTQDSREIITNIICKSSIITFTLFEKLNRDTLFAVYRFLLEYNFIFHLSSATLEGIKDIILKKYENERIYIIYPTIDDLLDEKIYKLYVKEQLFFVPLWNKENYYEYGDTEEEIVVFCIPELDEHIRIDEHNDIHVEVHCLLINLLTNPLITVSLGTKDYFISAEKLYIRPFQKYIIEEGLPKYHLDESNNPQKGNIIVSVYLE
jgi:hypothetical protein